MNQQISTEPANLREILSRRLPVLCSFTTIPDPGVVMILGASGFDLVVLDAEHGPFTRTSARACVDALARTPAKAVMRIVANEPARTKEVLDLGVDGILVPMVGSAEDAAAAVDAARFLGRRC
jgi:4-hydroxy-2-oxoheptanedioate aldolase